MVAPVGRQKILFRPATIRWYGARTTAYEKGGDDDDGHIG
jgi:hypothetical protein